MNYDEFKQQVNAFATKASLLEYELYFNESSNINVETYKDEVKAFSSATIGGVGFRCIVNGKLGNASTELFSEEEAESLVKRAMENAGSIESEDEVFIYEGGEAYPEVSVKPFPLPTADTMIQAALELQKNLYAQDERIIDGTQTIAAAEITKVNISNSKGLNVEYENSNVIVYAQPIASDGEEMYTEDAYAMKPIEEVDLKELANEAVLETVSVIGAGKVDSGKYKAVFSAKTMAKLLRTFSSIFSAEQVQHGLSLLKGKENESIASSIVTIVDDPFYKTSFYQAPFDAEGVPTFKKNVIEDGKLITFLHNLKTAKKANIKTTANAYKQGYAGDIQIMPYNFYINPMQGKKEDLFKQVVDGIYITSLEGMHAGANPTTGDFSLAASGFLIKDGEKTNAVKGFTVSGNFYELLKKIEIIGEDLEFVLPYGSNAMYGSPSVVISEMSIAGQ